MASLISLKDRFDIAFGNDPDADRHGIVTPSVGLMNPNHYLAVAIWYLFQHRPGWRPDAAVGKTLVSSSMIDRVAHHIGRGWLKCRSASNGLSMVWWMARLALAVRRARAHRSCGATARCGPPTRMASSSELTGGGDHGQVTGRDPGEHYRTAGELFGSPVYERIDAPANRVQKRRSPTCRRKW
jgi:phosphoglucomutase